MPQNSFRSSLPFTAGTRQRLKAWALLLLVSLGWLLPGLDQAAWAQTTTVCYPADDKGADGPVDYGAYCWIDFSPMSLAQARSGSGQNFRVNLQGGAYLTFTLRIQPGNTAGNNMYAVAVPSWTGAAFGNSAFNNIPGNPILYQDQNNQNNPQDTVTLSAITLHANGSTELPFVFVAADGESSNSGETVSFTTTGMPWALVSAPGQSNPARNMPVLTPATTVGNSTGSQTVDIDGVVAGSGGGVGSYVFTTDNSPGTVTAELEGNGLQGVLFGLKYHTIGLSLTKAHVGNFEIGGTGTYTLNVANTVQTPEINPPSGPQPIRIVDTLPTGLTYAPALTDGNGFWTCNAIGQVVTCDAISLQDLTTSKTFPPLILGVNVAGDAPALLTNNAEVSDPTTSTLVFNVCEVENNGVCPSSATSTDGDETVVLRPDLSGSTKDVEDVDGGLAKPGDTLRYTINLVNSPVMAAVNLQVTDTLVANLGSLMVESIPPGATDASTGNTLNVTGISLPPGGTASIVFTAVISGSAPDGATINNTATISMPGGVTVGTAVAPSVTVQLAPPASAGAKYLYVNTGGTLTRARPTAASVTFSNDVCYNLAPLAATLTLQNASVFVRLRARRSGSSGGRTIRVQLRRNGTAISNWTGTVNANSAGYTNREWSFNLNSGNTVHAAGSVLSLCIDHQNAGRTVELSLGAAGDSYVRINAQTVINVNSVDIHSAPYGSGAQSPRYLQGDHAYIRAVVSDPFGSADITSATVRITDAGGAVVVPATAMPVAAASPTASTRIFEYDYTIPANPRIGGWTAEVVAHEGSEGEISHTGIGGFPVEGAISLGKTWVDGLAGNTVALTIAGGTTAAGGTSTPASTTPATATSMASATLTLAEAFTVGPSGDYAVTLACTRNKDAVALAVGGSGMSRTITMPNDSAVTCVYTNKRNTPLTIVKTAVVYSDPVNGTSNPKAIPGAFVDYSLDIFNPATIPTDSDMLFVTDVLPAQMALYVADLGSPGTGPMLFLDGPPSSGLTFGLADLSFSSDGGATWSYTPTPGPDGTDAQVTAIRVNPKGAFSPNNGKFQLKFRARIK